MSHSECNDDELHTAEKERACARLVCFINPESEKDKSMKIKVPIDSVDEAQPLLDAGAEELYCGVYHVGWEKMGVFSNARHMYYGNLRHFSELASIVQTASSKDVPVYLCLNDYYPKSVSALLERDIEQAVQCGVRGFIISDTALVPVIRSVDAASKIILSSLNPCFNRYALSFFKDRGFDRIVLPLSQLSLQETHSLALAAQTLGVEVEVFVDSKTCKNVNGYCLYHNVGIESFYQEKRQKGIGVSMAFLSFLRRVLPASVQNVVGKFLWASSFAPSQSCRKENRIRVFSKKNKKAETQNMVVSHEHSFAKSYCGLCKLYYYSKWNIHAGKIIGRGSFLKEKVRQLQLIKAYCAGCTEQGFSEDEFIEKGHALYESMTSKHCIDMQCELFEKYKEEKAESV